MAKTPATVLAEINQYIIANGVGAISGPVLNGVLQDLCDLVPPVPLVNGLMGYDASGNPLAVTSGGSSGSSYRPITTPGSVTVQPTDTILLFNKSTSGVSSILLPQSSTRNGLPLFAKDLTYDANTNNITWVPASGETLDGFSAAASITNGIALIAINGGFKKFYPLLSGGWYQL